MENIGRFDQLMASLADIAAMMFQYYDHCIKAGFTAEQALALTISFQETSIKANTGK
ncbi:hypothetical protein D3C71_2215240 [compost metagenome]